MVSTSNRGRVHRAGDFHGTSVVACGINRSHHIRFDTAWSYRIDSNVFVSMYVGGVPCEPDDGVFGSGISRTGGGAANASSRSKVNDSATTIIDHVWHCGTGVLEN